MPVYLIRAGNSGPVKIGWAQDAKRRRASLQSANHEHLIIIRLLNGRRHDETIVQKRFEHLWLHGEWHRFSSELLDVQFNFDDLPVPLTSRRRSAAQCISIRAGSHDARVRFEASLLEIAA